MARRNWIWTPKNEARAETVMAVTDELRAYWPLTLRQIYYRLLSQRHFQIPEWQAKKNGELQPLANSYNALSTLIKWMRIDGKLPWQALEDRTRSISDKKGYSGVEEFIDTEISWFLDGYNRCLIQGQEVHVEVWFEKEGLSKIFLDTIFPYCIRGVVCRGYQSVTFIADFYKRAEKAMNIGQKPIILYFGDLDPSGEQMLEAIRDTFEIDMGLSGVEFQRVALSPEQVEEYDLPRDPTAAKKTDTRYKKYAERYGDLAVEIDALHPEQLKQIIRESIERVVDMTLFEQQEEVEEMDQDKLESLRSEIIPMIHEKLGIF